MPERHQWYRSSVVFLALLAAMNGVPALDAAPEAPRAGALSDAEKRIVAEVDRRQPQALALPIKAVENNSGTMNLAGAIQSDAGGPAHHQEPGAGRGRNRSGLLRGGGRPAALRPGAGYRLGGLTCPDSGLWRQVEDLYRGPSESR